jgi:hypothetical protein
VAAGRVRDPFTCWHAKGVFVFEELDSSKCFVAGVGEIRVRVLAIHLVDPFSYGTIPAASNESREILDGEGICRRSKRSRHVGSQGDGRERTAWIVTFR